MQRRYDKRHFRLQMIHYTQTHGIKRTAKAFGTTRATVPNANLRRSAKVLI
jgi:hypothetical protein